MPDPTTLDEWTALVRAADPSLSTPDAWALAHRLWRRHPGKPHVEVRDGALEVAHDGPLDLHEGWERVA